MIVDTASIKIKDPLVLTERILSLGGNWPSQRTYVLFKFTVVYFCLLMVLQYWELTYSVGDLTATALILEETIVTTTMYFGFLLLAQSRKQLEQVITVMKEDIASDATFENDEEKYLYFSYNIISQRIGKCVAFLATFVSILLYLNPAIQLLSSFVRGNFSNPYELPYRSYVMFDYRNPELYTLVYILQFPIIYVPVYHGGEVGMIVNMVLHLCAKLSVLSHRIRNIQPKHFNDDIKKVVIEHLKLTKYVYGCSRKILVFFSILFTATVGHKSQKVGDAFYNINWPEVNCNDRKALLTCIVNGQKTMHITAGRFYVFSLFGFTGIMKTSMAGFSMLRAGL
ncbi:uncharacterized protein LOC122404758 [Colletes gigas]|uniref:uncharacterized protein LOC122404758 n=1 Tax=Colletes gigas TaxID=935657 RepID=UPI001C9AD9B1|nr:uncharacterized protein LOC122404758 [Colletes gigas]